MHKTSLRKHLAGMKQKKTFQKHPIIITDADYDYILDEIECREN